MGQGMCITLRILQPLLGKFAELVNLIISGYNFHLQHHYRKTLP